ncbi:S-adenosyl-L-homocysteine hydrolase [Sulfitobacter aestuarii]|uniref:S-adenosyl-L-homocysteine hydrolase n=1 Tax=Sulfitobacter aestuarii TaxID=2161676 RepID=A0ABW5U8Y8_9RHOB
MKSVFSALTLAAILGFSATVASAQDVCMRAEEMRASLTDWYGERPLPGHQEADTQVWVSPEGDTWSLVRFMVDGRSCVMETGEDWYGGGRQADQLASLEQVSNR